MTPEYVLKRWESTGETQKTGSLAHTKKSILKVNKLQTGANTQRYLSYYFGSRALFSKEVESRLPCPVGSKSIINHLDTLVITYDIIRSINLLVKFLVLMQRTIILPCNEYMGVLVK